jgi:hypothetical protein
MIPFHPLPVKRAAGIHIGASVMLDRDSTLASICQARCIVSIDKAHIVGYTWIEIQLRLVHGSWQEEA